MKTRSPRRSRRRSLAVIEPAGPQADLSLKGGSALTKAAGRRLKIGAPGLKDLKFRVFLTYYHRDTPLLREVVAIMRKNELEPMWDENLLIGRGFDEQIKNYIAHAHVFVPLLTPAADSRKWVHQEIGYAMALNVPVLPLIVGKLPADREMLHHLHALRVERKDLSPVRQHMTRTTIRKLMEAHADARLAVYACADFHEQRAEMLASYCRRVLALDRAGLVRQKGGLSSFHIPTCTIKHRVWRERYGPFERSLEHCRLLKREREALFEHARRAGCRLIIYPKLSFHDYGDPARLVRLRTLLKFLRGMTDAKCQVALWTPEHDKENVTIVGDWFSAKSVYSQTRHGYFQTNFTRHAPSVREAIAEFDEEFDERLCESGVRPRDSRRHAIQEIEAEIAALEQQIAAKAAAISAKAQL